MSASGVGARSDQIHDPRGVSNEIITGDEIQAMLRDSVRIRFDHGLSHGAGTDFSDAAANTAVRQAAG